MLTHRDFSNVVIRALRDNGEARTVVFDAQSFSLHIAPESDEKRTLFLSNVYAEYISADADAVREQLLKNLAASASSIDGEESFDEVLVNLMPRVRPRAYFEIGLELALGEAGAKSKGGARVPFDVLAEDLGVSVAIDRPDSIHEVTDFSKWGTDFARAMAAARINLERRSAEPFIEIAPGTYASPWGDHFDAERMLLLDKIRALSVDGDPVALLPSRHRLFITGENDAAGLERIVAEAEAVLEGPRPLTSSAFVLREDGWHPYVPTAPTPAAARMRAWRETERATIYGEQKALLESRGEEAFVASVMMHEAGTLSVLTAGVPTLLPRTQLVSLNDMETGQFEIVPFDAFERVLGAKAEARAGLYPPRIFVDAFPTGREVADMKQLGAIEKMVPELFEQLFSEAARKRAPGAPAKKVPVGAPLAVTPFGGGAGTPFSPPAAPARGRALGVVGVIGIGLLVVRLLLLVSKPSRHYDYKPVYIPPPIPTTAFDDTALRSAITARRVVDDGAPAAVAVVGKTVYFIDAESHELKVATMPSTLGVRPSQRRARDPYGATPTQAVTTVRARLDDPVLVRHSTTIAATADDVYTLRGGALGPALVRTPTTGGASEVAAALDGEPNAIALGRDAVYVSLQGAKGKPGAVVAVPLGGGPARVLAKVDRPCAVAVLPYAGRERLYVVDAGRGVRGYSLGDARGFVPRRETTPGAILPQSTSAACSLATALSRVYWPAPAERAVGSYSAPLGTSSLSYGYTQAPAAVAAQGAFVYVLSRTPAATAGGVELGAISRQTATGAPHTLATGPGLDVLSATPRGAVWSRHGAADDDGEGVYAYGSVY
jgi:hypothetical protein